MPAKSEAQRRLMAMALHNPRKIRKENSSVLKMSESDLREFSYKPKSLRAISRTKTK